MNAQNRLFLWITIAAVVVTVAGGIWTGRTGKPYPVALLTVHKLISIGAVVFAVLFIISMLRHVSPSAWAVGMIVVAAVSAICLIATGGIMSAGNSHTVLKTLHIAATATFVLSGAGMAVLLISRL